jgi:phage replication O-like protein O
MQDVSMNEKFTAVPNNIIEEIFYHLQLSGYQWRIMWVIIRLTLGHHRSWAIISISYLEKATGIKRRHIHDNIKMLCEKGIIIKKRCGKYMSYGLAIVTDFGNDEKSTVTDFGNNIVTDFSTQERKKEKRIYTGDENEIIQTIFDYWNEQKIIVHKKLSATMKTKIRSRLKDYDVQDIKNAIRNYGMVINGGDKFYFTKRWSIEEFFPRGLTRFLDECDPLKNMLKDNYKKKPKTDDSPDLELRY